MADILIDNTAFAGLMRCYRPDLEEHQMFVADFPEHRQVDLVSAAQILTSICLCDNLILEASSKGHYNSQADIIPAGGKLIIRDFGGSWVYDLLEKLPNEIKQIFSRQAFNDDAIEKLNDRSIQLSFDAMNSNFKKNLLLEANEKIPNVYTSKSYVNRGEFLKLNFENGNPLTEAELAQAMFLHRGIFLDALSNNYDFTYFPYSYRGKMLSSLPPGFSTGILEFDTFNFLHSNIEPTKRDVLAKVSEVYYEFLGRLSWTRYENTIPFIGAAILTKANYNVALSFELALEFRNAGGLKTMIEELNSWSGDRVMFEHYLSEFRKELEICANRLGLNKGTEKISQLANLFIFWLPLGIKDFIVEASNFLPSEWRGKLNSYFSRICKMEGHQLLFLDHVEALKNHHGRQNYR